ncbi:uncharacterized protein LOC107491463 [Arachis duranensis]|uniref:Uncharacterized protein LOC107491463 n=1 Tax=Arachis duranensis TaxID=130453 RepID=A0A9C6WTN9_ARADU|nr:uncharacterized protein LOC107491463 [Arachis duranensis]
MGDIDGWANIHHDIFLEISKHFYSYDDFIQLRLVCKQWSLKLPEISSKILWLLVPESFSDYFCEDKKEGYHSRQPIADEVPVDIQSLDEDKIHHLKLPEMQTKLIRGSFGGWLIVVDLYQGSMYMLDAFTKVRLDLPPISTFPDIIDCNPNNRGFEYTIRDFGDVYLDDYEPQESSGFIYAVDDRGQLYEFDTNTKSGPVGGIHEAKPSYDDAVRGPSQLKYLVGCANGSLLMLVRHSTFHRGFPRVYKFDIYELKKNAKEWCRLDSLKNCVAIIGLNSSVQMLPASIQTKGNQIYFTDENLLDCKTWNWAEHQDIGIFDLDDGSCQRLLSDVKFMCSPVWCYSSSLL